MIYPTELKIWDSMEINQIWKFHQMHFIYMLLLAMIFYILLATAQEEDMLSGMQQY